MNIQATGERLIPEDSDPTIFWEHIYRYRFALRFVQGKEVLDIASGEGYGAAALKQGGASSVIGIDISEEACACARHRYGIDARQGSAESIPLADHSVDVVVSFETIEHIPNPDKFLKECNRVLKPGGTMIISTPNKDVYHTEAASANPFHCSELTEDEFTALIRMRFATFRLFTQRPKIVSPWSMRVLAAQDIGQRHLPGFMILKRGMRMVTCSHVRPKHHGYYKQHPMEAILTADKMGASFGNPYSVRKHHKWHREKPIYFLAVAESANK